MCTLASTFPWAFVACNGDTVTFTSGQIITEDGYGLNFMTFVLQFGKNTDEEMDPTRNISVDKNSTVIVAVKMFL